MSEHSEDYKRGLLDMLDALAIIKDNTLEFRWVTPISTSVFGHECRPLSIALQYRKELESRKAIQTAVNLLEENGYTITEPSVTPGPPRGASDPWLKTTAEFIEYLEKQGYSVTFPD